MLGNLVYPDHQDRTIVKVIGISDGVVHFLLPNGKQNLCGERESWHFADHIQPIPLAPEVLTKCGFVQQGTNFIIADDFYDIIIFELTDSIWTIAYHDCEMSLPDQRMHIGYVHELQNFLSMCGVEKEIVL